MGRLDLCRTVVRSCLETWGLLWCPYDCLLSPVDYFRHQPFVPQFHSSLASPASLV